MKILERLSETKWLGMLLILIVLSLVVFILIREWDTLVTFPWQLDIGFLLLTIGLHSIALGLTFVVWHLMMIRFADFDQAWVNFRFYYFSTLAKRVPTAIWYVGGRLLMYKGIGVPGSIVLNAILMENVLIGVAGAFLFSGFLPFYTPFTSATVSFISSTIGVLGILILLIKPKVFVLILNDILVKWRRRPLLVAPERSDILVWSGLYVLTCCFAGGAFYCIVRALAGLELRLVDALGISTIAMLVSLISMILPGGLGLKELTATALLSYWMPFSTALVISVAFRLLQTIDEVIWALVALCFTDSSGKSVVSKKTTLYK